MDEKLIQFVDHAERQGNGLRHDPPIVVVSWLERKGCGGGFFVHAILKFLFPIRRLAHRLVLAAGRSQPGHAVLERPSFTC